MDSEQPCTIRQLLSARDTAEIYRPLTEANGIRLIRLLPGAWDDVVKVNLLHTTLERAKDLYNALSYCWGDPKVTQKIRCNGKDLRLTTNAVAFLRQLRSPNVVKTVWMDSICINQSDLDERQAQVKMMHLIFKHARHVDAWLGDEANDSALAFEYATTLDTARILRAWFELYEATSVSGIKPASEMWICDLQHVDQPRREKLILAVLHVSQRPWTSRIWIQQEMVFGREVSIHCGPDTITWDQFSCLLRLCRPHQGGAWPAYEGMSRISTITISTSIDAANSIQLRRRPSYQPDRRRPFFELVLEILGCWGCLASDPRDKIYALLNLVPDLSHNIIAPDYNLPWPVVFANFSRMFYVNFDPTLTLFCWAGSGLPSSQARTELPSWVIDWRHSKSDHFGNTRFCAGTISEHFEIERPSFLLVSAVHFPTLPQSVPFDRRKANMSTDAEALVTRALMMDQIVYIAKSAYDPGDPESEFYDLRTIQDLVEMGSRHARTLSHTYLNGDSTREVYRRTITVDLDGLGNTMTQEYCREEWEVWEEYCRASEKGREEPAFLHAMLRANFSSCHTFATTAQGYFCLVSKSSQVGDYVLIIPGSQIPVTIHRERPSDNEGSELFSLVAGCYIHGMMHGEAGKMWDILDQFEVNMERAAEVLKACWASGEEGALHENYARVLSTITTRKILII